MKIKCQCKNCEGLFVALNIKYKFCGKICHDLYYHKKYKCKICNKSFITYEKDRKYCSRKCYLKFHSKGTKKCICKNCGLEFYSEKNRLKVGRGIYCSRKCADKGKRFIRKRSIKHCEICNKEFETNTAKIKKYGYGRFCSQLCFQKHRNKMISIDEWKFNTKFKHGHYTSKISGIKEFYGSSYELKRMKQLDKMVVNWTKKHGIRIEYLDKNNKIRCYIPDFLIENKIIEEVKPLVLVNSKMNNNIFKKLAAEKYCKKNNLEYRTITEKELGIKI